MSRQMKVLCGVPQDQCTGGILHTDQLLGTNRCHSSRSEAMKCYSHYLQNKGFTKLSSREFVDPESGRIQIVPKKTKFGGRLRSGKGEEGSRFEPLRGAGLIF